MGINSNNDWKHDICLLLVKVAASLISRSLGVDVDSGRRYFKRGSHAYRTINVDWQWRSSPVQRAAQTSPVPDSPTRGSHPSSIAESPVVQVIHLRIYMVKGPGR